jgi:hypothetical protein
MSDQLLLVLLIDLVLVENIVQIQTPIDLVPVENIILPIDLVPVENIILPIDLVQVENGGHIHPIY